MDRRLHYVQERLSETLNIQYVHNRLQDTFKTVQGSMNAVTS
ncbi:unnamed protein product, partial [Didymodactylos carnosus]